MVFVSIWDPIGGWHTWVRFNTLMVMFVSFRSREDALKFELPLVNSCFLAWEYLLKMKGCCAVGCKNHPERPPQGIGFHRFPLHPVIRQAWVRATCRENWQPNSTSLVCSAHFEEKYLSRTPQSTVKIRKGAVPTIFLKHVMEVNKDDRKLLSKPLTPVSRPQCTEGTVPPSPACIVEVSNLLRELEELKSRCTRGKTKAGSPEEPCTNTKSFPTITAPEISSVNEADTVETPK